VKALEDEAFRGFVAARGQALVRTAYLLTGDQQLAEDLVQSALEKTIRSWRSIKHHEALESYVRRTMYREQVSVWRRRRFSEQLSGAVPEPRRSSTAPTDTLEERLVLEAGLRRLPTRQRTVLVLRYFEDMTEQQVADAMGVSIGTVKSTAHKALARLRASYPDPVAVGGGSGGEHR
jgi:RNA polymerase sigma-70 factor (sigma-E family)